MSFVNNDISLIAVMSMAALLPFIIAAGTCYLKFSVVFVLLRNGLGLQQVPSNMVLNALALMLAFYVMQPIVQNMYEAYLALEAPLNSVAAVIAFLDSSLDGYKVYLATYSDPELLEFFERARQAEPGQPLPALEPHERSLFALMSYVEKLS